MSSENPLTISALMPVYNGAHHLGEAVGSIFAQSHLPTELVVVDDGSTDDSAALIHQLAATAPIPVRYCYQENQGVGAARNRCLELAAGQLLAFLDHDDTWMADKLALQVRYLHADSDLAAVIGYTQLAVPAAMPAAEARLDGQTGLNLLLQASLFRRTLFAQAGAFDPLRSEGEDIDWFLRALEQPVKILIHPDLVVTYRRHEGNLTGSFAGCQQQLLAALQHALRRRRAPRQCQTRCDTCLCADRCECWRTFMKNDLQGLLRQTDCFVCRRSVRHLSRIARGSRR